MFLGSELHNTSDQPQPIPSTIDSLPQSLDTFSAHICDNVIFVWDIDSNLVRIMGGTYETFGIRNTAQSSPPELWFERIVPEDRERVIDTLRSITPQQEKVSCTYRIKNDRGETIDVLDRAKIIRSGGKVTQFVGVTTNITALARMLRQLQSSRDTAKIASNEKSKFLANMSHELRTPLSAIIASIDIAQRKSTRKSELASLYKIIQRNAYHVLRLVDDILDLSKIEARKFSVTCKKINIADFISDCMQTLYIQANQKNIQLIANLKESCPEIVCTDDHRLRQILINLLSNALKFTFEGFIQIDIDFKKSTTAKEPSRLEITVQDTGIGIPAKDLDKLFLPFSQIDSGPQRQFPGTGLGLALSCKIAKELGGQLELIQSTPAPQKSHGSTFRLTIPVDLKNVDSKNVDLTENETQSEAITQTDAAAAKPKTYNSSYAIRNRSLLDGFRLLLVDDADDNRVLLKNILERAGARVKTAKNGQKCIELLEADCDGTGTSTFDVILMDIEMPIMDGPMTLNEIRSRGWKVPVVALTAHAMVEHRAEYLSRGFNGYLSKPVDQIELADLVKKLCSDRTIT